MSGTSLDGLDLALCEFESTANGVDFKILAAHTVEYTDEWRSRLSGAKDLSASGYFELHAAYGRYIAQQVHLFLEQSPVKPLVIASHGHTVFHQPSSGFSTQVGCGATIAAHTGITTVCDFRSLDVANGGQGAPLVPVGDKLLFGRYQACLNIGGIANISFDDALGQRVAYDVCEANMLLNFLAEKAGSKFDRDGAMARSGQVDQSLLDALNGLPYYSQNGARSIGWEWFEANILVLLQPNKRSINDLLATATEHVAQVVANELTSKKISSVLVTGGGAFNTLLIEKISAKTSCRIIVPDRHTVNFKEALIFAFLGHLRLNDTVNTLSSVTGAHSDSIGGAVYRGRA